MFPTYFLKKPFLLRRIGWLSIWAIIGILSINAVVRFRSPSGTRSAHFNDHLSHIGTAILFWYRGLAVYKPIVTVCNQPQDLLNHHPKIERTDFFDRCYLRERPNQDSFMINWQKYPKPYPIGLFITMLPLALLYNSDMISERTAMHWTAIQYTFYAVIASLLLGLVLLDSKMSFLQFLGLSVLWFCVSMEMILWGLDGFYDPIACGAAIYAFYAYHQKKPQLSLCSYLLSLCLHFRMLYYAPLPLFLVGQYRFALIRSKTSILLLLLILLFGAVFLISFLNIYSAMNSFPDWNLLHHPYFTQLKVYFWGAALLMIGILSFFRFYLSASCVLCMAFILQSTRQIQSWHVLALIPLLATIPPRKHKFIALMLMSCFIYTVSHIVYFDVPYYQMVKNAMVELSKPFL